MTRLSESKTTARCHSLNPLPLRLSSTDAGVTAMEAAAAGAAGAAEEEDEDEAAAADEAPLLLGALVLAVSSAELMLEREEGVAAVVDLGGCDEEPLVVMTGLKP
jgi:hypothetical protein